MPVRPKAQSRRMVSRRPHRAGPKFVVFFIFSTGGSPLTSLFQLYLMHGKLNFAQVYENLAIYEFNEYMYPPLLGLCNRLSSKYLMARSIKAVIGNRGARRSHSSPLFSTLMVSKWRVLGFRFEKFTFETNLHIMKRTNISQLKLQHTSYISYFLLHHSAPRRRYTPRLVGVLRNLHP